MARKPRIHYIGAIYHVMLRGNNRKDIFFSDSDRYFFYSLLSESIHRFGYKIHAFCLMTNHIHLMVEVGEITLSKIIQNIAFRYTQKINKNRKRIGHLFQGRYKAKLVENEKYFLELGRYIHLNPVEAKIVENAVDYPWSSFRDYLGKTNTQWLSMEKTLIILNAQFQYGNITYEEFMATGVNPEKPSLYVTSTGEIEIDDQVILEINSKRMPAAMRKLHIDEIIEIISQFLGIQMSNLKEIPRSYPYVRFRGYVALFAQKFTHTTLKDLALIFNVDPSTLSKAIVRLQKKRLIDDKENQAYIAIENRLAVYLENSTFHA